MSETHHTNHDLLFMYRKLSLIAIFFLHMICGMAQTPSNAAADSLRVLQQSSDYVEASLIVVSPGKLIYSGGGHTALRLSCPMQNMDYYFSFEMALTPIEKLRFLSGTARAGYIYTDFQNVVELYREEGREMRGLKLNLTPVQEQELWRYLDGQCERGPNRYFDYMNSNCNEVILSAIEICLGKETIEWKYDNPDFSSSYRSFIDRQFTHSPWNSMLLNLLTGEKGDKMTVGTNWLWPNLLLSEAQKACIVDSVGGKRPLVVGDEQVLLKLSKENKPFPITPKMVFMFLLVLSVLITIYQLITKQRNIGYVADVPLMVIQAVLGCIYSYTTLSNLSAGFNWIIIVLNPLPLIIWLLLRKKPVMRQFYLLFTIVLVVYLACTPRLPQLQTTPIAILFIAIAVRTAYHYISRRFVHK